jgi:hypothetical protein
MFPLPSFSRNTVPLNTLSCRAILLPVSVAPIVPIAGVVLSTLRPAIPVTIVFPALGSVRAAISISILSLRG